MVEKNPHLRHATIAHVLGVLLAIAAYLAIFAVTGDSDLFFAIGTGVMAMMGTWLFLFTMHRQKNRP
jgi:hypothetical protein